MASASEERFVCAIALLLISFFIIPRVKIILMNQRQQFNYYFLIAFGILNTVCLILVFSALTFSINLSLTRWHFPLAVCSSIAINYFASQYYSGLGYKSVFFKTTGILLALIILSIGIGACIYDTSYDGQTYHQEALIQLKEGWNPFYSQLPSKVAHSIWVNHYPKGAEIPQAAIYAFLNRIETGKATNALLAFASFCLCVSLFAGATKLSAFKIYLLSALFALNPIAINQMFTYYVDGQLASLLCCLIIASCLVFNNIDKYGLILFGSIVIITVNIKFTAVGFVGVLIIGLLIALLYKRSANQFRGVLIAAALSATIGICFVGFNPYITNTILHQQPFYPLMGTGKLAMDVRTLNSPKGFSEKNRLDKFIISIFSRPDNVSPKLKIPFTINTEDLVKSAGAATNFSGFGFLFGEIILLTALLFCCILYLCRKERAHCLGLTYKIGVLLFSVFILSEAWWARYVPQLWFVPLTILIAGESIKRISIKYLLIVAYILFVVNSGSILVLSFMSNVARTIGIEYQFAQFKAANETIRADFGPFRSIRIRFDEHKIKYIEDNITEAYGATGDGKYVINILGSSSKVKIGSIPEDVPKPVILKWISSVRKKIKGNEQ